MSLYSQTIKNLISGISQQPPILRHPEQLDYQENGMSTEVGGLQKRPPTIHVKTLDETILVDGVKPLVHLINRDAVERYIVTFTGEDVHVHDLEGNEKVVVAEGNAFDYITTDDPRKDLKVLTIADYTFVANINTKAQMGTEKTGTQWETQGALVNVKSGQYGRTYQIIINGSVAAQVRTPDGSESTDVKLIDTNDIVNKLCGGSGETYPYNYGASSDTNKKGVVTTTLYNTGYSFEKGEGWIYIYKNSTSTIPTETVEELYDRTCTYLINNPTHGESEDPINGYYKRLIDNGETIYLKYSKYYYTLNTSHLAVLQTAGWYIENNTSKYEVTLRHPRVATTLESIDTKDGFNNTAMYGMMRSVQKFSMLPATAPDGYTVLVKGEVGSNTDDYYVVYDATERVWRETVKPGILSSFNKSTMPHVLVREADGSFTFREAEWGDRTTGDDDSNPVPSFIDSPIKDIFFFRNRLGLLAGENVILSRSADFFQYWMATAIDVLDTDTIDLAVSSDRVSILNHAIPFQDELLLFAQQTQFVLKADGVLSPKNARIDQVTSFDSNTSVRPVGIGRRVYFPTERAEYTSINEFYAVQDVTNVKNAQDISAHVPTYITNGVHKLISNTIENLLLVLTTSAENKVFVYKFLFNDETRLQSSWSHWDLGENAVILGGSFIGSTLYLIVKRGNGLFLEKLVFTYNTKDYPSDEMYRIFMDRKVVVPVTEGESYNPTYNYTIVDINGAYGAKGLPAETYAIITPDGVYKEYTSAQIVNGLVQILGDWVGQNLIIGKPFNFKFRWSEIMIKSQDERGTKSDTEGRLQVRNAWINHVESGYYKVTVEHKDKETYTYEMTGRILGSSRNLLGDMPSETGQFKFPVQGQSTNVTITVESPDPVPVAFIGSGWEAMYYRRSNKI